MQQIDMAARTLRIATRKSPLAMWQANYVKAREVLTGTGA